MSKEESKSVTAFVTELARAVRNINMDDPVQFAAFRQVAKKKVNAFLNSNLEEKDKHIERINGEWQYAIDALGRAEERIEYLESQLKQCRDSATGLYKSGTKLLDDALNVSTQIEDELKNLRFKLSRKDKQLDELFNDNQAALKSVFELGERLEAAEELLKCVPLNGQDNVYGNNIYLSGFNEALEKYQSLKNQTR